MIKGVLKTIIKKFMPERVKSILVWKIYNIRHQSFLKKLRSDILAFYSNKSNISPDEAEVLEYLRTNPVTIFPYDFQSKYNPANIEVHFDDSCGMPYVIHEDKRLYFKKSLTQNQVRNLYHGLKLDQDEDSPHRYLTAEFSVESTDVIADIGAAEGNFSLSNVEKARKIYLFECDPEWIEALQETFKPWKDKVEIQNKFVSNTNADNTVSIDDFTGIHNDITFFKVDIEGEEFNFLEGAKNYLSTQPKLKMAICTYHRQEDETKFTELLKRHHFHAAASRRYMIFYHDQHIKAPYLRRGILRAEKRNNV